MSPPRRVVVWGNCQAAPIADLLRAPLVRLGLEVVDLPPVYLLTPDEVARVHELMAGTALLVAQPIRDEYRVPGCATERLAALLPASGRLVTFPLVYHSGGLPYQVTANGADGARVPAPLTEYHDLRLLLAARDRSAVDDVLASWPVRAGEAELRAHAAASLAQLRARESTCDVTVSDLVTHPGAMHTLNHPTNAVLAEIAGRVLQVATRAAADPLADPVVAPEREYLGAVRTPVEGPDAPAGGAAQRTLAAQWTLAGRRVPWDDVIRAHLDWYRTRPDVVADGLARNARRLGLLGPLVAA